MGSASVDSTMWLENNLGKKIQISQRSKRQNLNFPCAKYYVESLQMDWYVGIVLGVITNLEIT